MIRDAIAMALAIAAWYIALALVAPYGDNFAYGPCSSDVECAVVEEEIYGSKR